MRKAILLTSAALALSVTPVWALAAPASNASSHRTVNLADLDLNSKGDRVELDRRAQSAIEDVCSERNPAPMARSSRNASCRLVAEEVIHQQLARAIERAKPSSVTRRADFTSIPPNPELRVVAINVSPADLSTPASMAVVRGRLADAIEQVCGSHATVESSQYPQVDACRAEAWHSVELRIASLKQENRQRMTAR